MSSPSVIKVAIDGVAPNVRRGGDVRVMLSPRTVRSTSGFGGILILEPGEFVCEHYHPYSEEFIYVVAGVVSLRVGTEYFTLAANEALMVPIGLKHRMENPGSEQAKLVFQLAPLAPRPELGHVDTETHPTNASAPVLDVGGLR